jgi:hypothetical protein
MLSLRIDLVIVSSFELSNSISIPSRLRDASPEKRLVPFQLVSANPFENTLSVLASNAWTVTWRKQLERH